MGCPIPLLRSHTPGIISSFPRASGTGSKAQCRHTHTHTHMHTRWRSTRAMLVASHTTQAILTTRQQYTADEADCTHSNHTKRHSARHCLLIHQQLHCTAQPHTTQTQNTLSVPTSEQPQHTLASSKAPQHDTRRKPAGYNRCLTLSSPAPCPTRTRIGCLMAATLPASCCCC